MTEFDRNIRIIKIFIHVVKLFPQSIRLSLFNNARNIQGKIGIGIRYVLVKTLAKSCGINVVIHEGVYLKNIENMEIGNNVSINSMAYLDASTAKDKGLSLGNNVSIAHGVTIMASTHNYNMANIPIKKQGGTDKKTVIHNDVWIGAKATIIAGVVIENGCVIGANSVVTKKTEPYSVYVGSPAIKIKERFIYEDSYHNT